MSALVSFTVEALGAQTRSPMAASTKMLRLLKGTGEAPSRCSRRLFSETEIGIRIQHAVNQQTAAI